MAKIKPVFSHFLEDRIRFLLPVIVVSVAKFAGTIAVANLPESNYWSKLWGVDGWWLVFTGWDTEWYERIVRLWYPPSFDPHWAFFPLFPFSAKLVNFVVGNPHEALVIVSSFFGVAWIPLFQLVAERYMSRDDAFGCTLMTAFFPTVFLFTTVAYTESLFLFACLATWLYYLKGKMLYSAIFAAVATLTKTYGIAMIIPVALGLLLERKWGKMMWLTIPFMALTSWALYFSISTGHVFLWEPIFYTVWPQKPWSFEISNKGVFSVVFLPLLFYLAFQTRKVDRRLAAYTLILSLVTLPNSSLWGWTRYLSFLFPAWLSFKSRNRVVLAALILVFYSGALWLWHSFSMGAWFS